MDTKKLFTFLNAGRSTDKTRYFMTEVYFDAETPDHPARLVSIDGRRLHWVDLTPSYVEAFGLKDSESSYIILNPKRGTVVRHKLEAQFPNYARVIPDYAPAADDSKGERPKLSGDPTQCIPQFCAREAIALNYKYVADLLKASPTWYYAKDTEAPATHAVHFVNDDDRVHAVIMPMMFD